MPRLGNSSKIEQEKSQLKWPPFRRSDFTRLFSVYLGLPSPRCGGHRAIGDSKRFENSWIFQCTNSVIYPATRKLRSTQQLFGDLKSPAFESEPLSLCANPCEVPAYQSPKLLLHFFRAADCTQRFHGELYARNRCRFNLLHVCHRHPFRCDIMAMIG